ncbi:hypothetical protein HOY80DRAFT_1067986 [Tuber brumale]|nr:hypothetical protein HOY80DRAFT_1067986 [Tuber brumale]
MGIELRRGAPDDSVKCGRICFDAFKSLAERHGFPPDFPSPEIASGLLSMLLQHPGFYAVVALGDGEIVGSNFMDERSEIVGIGPISVDPTTQKRGVGDVHRITGPGILVPSRNHALFSWCLENRLNLVFQMTLMSIGLYSEPEGAYLPSVLY